MSVFASVLPEQEPVERALVVMVRSRRIPVNVVRLPTNAAVLVVDERDVDGGAANPCIFREKVFGGIRIALGIVVRPRLIEQQ